MIAEEVRSYSTYVRYKERETDGVIYGSLFSSS
jgi:hypothetical protein